MRLPCARIEKAMETDRRDRLDRSRRPGLLSLSAVLFFLLALVPVRSLDFNQGEGARRTIKLKIALDEESKRVPGLSVLEVRKLVTASSRFFERHFGLSLKIQEIVRWRSDNTKWDLAELYDDLFGSINRGECDVVIGISGQIRSESRVFGVASYDQGYILVKKSLNSYMGQIILTHELCHVFGAVDLKIESSVMNKDAPKLECDDFTKQIVRLHRNRRFRPGIFPLSPADQESAVALYEQRKSLGRREAGLSLRLAALFLEKRDSEKAIKECLEAERIAPGDPAIRTLLERAYRQKEKVGSGHPSLPSP
jgi:hypothetical protein